MRSNNNKMYFITDRMCLFSINISVVVTEVRVFEGPVLFSDKKLLFWDWRSTKVGLWVVHTSLMRCLVVFSVRGWPRIPDPERKQDSCRHVPICFLCVTLRNAQQGISIFYSCFMLKISALSLQSKVFFFHMLSCMNAG